MIGPALPPWVNGPLPTAA